ncbi:hypothetical protein IFR05_000693 [Cadophora sp. M221]|nr:hypothetical protein IFR05_000693 [Cadophora sp. M221]
MNFQPEYKYKEKCGAIGDIVPAPYYPQGLRDQPPPAMGIMEGDFLNTRYSSKSATTATTMPADALAPVEKLMENVVDDEPSHSRNSEFQVSKTPKKPKTPKSIAPDYKQKKDAYFVHLVNVVKYEKFANDAQALSSHFIKRSSMDALWYKTLKNHYANWREDPSGAPLGRKKTLAQANQQTRGYEGFDSNRHWQLQNMMHGMEGLSFVKEVDPKFGHFRGMESARRKRKAKVRLAAAKSDESKDVVQEDTAMGV